MDEVYHLVCHECPEEGVYEERASAVAAQDRHEGSTGHRTSLLDIAGGTEPSAADVEPTA